MILPKIVQYIDQTFLIMFPKIIQCIDQKLFIIQYGRRITFQVLKFALFWSFQKQGIFELLTGTVGV